MHKVAISASDLEHAIIERVAEPESHISPMLVTVHIGEELGSQNELFER